MPMHHACSVQCHITDIRFSHSDTVGICDIHVEPICAVGMGVAGLFSALNKDGSWRFKNFSLTSVSILLDSLIIQCIMLRMVRNSVMIAQFIVCFAYWSDQ